MATAKHGCHTIINYPFGLPNNVMKRKFMKQRTSESDLLADIKKVMAPLFIILWIVGMVFFFTLKSISIPVARTPEIPDFAFDNFGPCLESSQNIVDKFVVGDQQFICANMRSNETNVYLELHIYTSDKNKQVYVDGGSFSSGPIAFAIYPPLPPGNYWAKITWARPALVSFELEVVGK